MGSRRDARTAGTMPKKIPTAAENPKPIAKDHQGRETGKPVARLTVIPMALRGLWGSFFSRYGGEAFSLPLDARLRRGFRSRLEFVVGEPVPPAIATPELLMQRVQMLRGAEK